MRATCYVSGWTSLRKGGEGAFVCRYVYKLAALFPVIEAWKLLSRFMSFLPVAGKLGFVCGCGKGGARGADRDPLVVSCVLLCIHSLCKEGEGRGWLSFAAWFEQTGCV